MADTKVTGLTENTTVAGSDLLYLVDDPGNTPASQKATVANVVAGGLATEQKTRTINFVIDGGGSEIADGIKGDFVIDFACTIAAWTLLADQSGAIKIDLWKDSYANFPPTNDDSICNAHEPEIAASGTKAQDTDIADWSGEAITAGDVIRVNVDSCTTITRCTLALKVMV